MNLQKPEKLFSGFRVATMIDNGNPYGIVDDMTLGVSDGRILWMVGNSEVPDFDEPVPTVKGEDTLLTPGLIDCHTHLVYGGNRASEWEMLRAGSSYSEIASAGGGIVSTVKHTRAASEQELLNAAIDRTIGLLSEGVTTVEIKSGYGLDLETELKMLRVANALPSHLPVSVEATLLGAHTVPPEYKNRPNDYVDLVCEQMIPEAKELCTAVDVFCELIAFDLDQTRRVMEAALAAGLKVKVHAEQLSRTGAAATAAELGALSADHLEYLSPADCQVLGNSNTVATLLPGAFYCLGETQKPPVQSLLEHNVPIAIATDHNPGSSPLFSLLLAGNMAVSLFGLTAEQAFRGVTINAARALGLQDSIGTIENGKRADFAIWDVDSPAEILYGIGDNRCIQVFKSGESTVRLED